MGSGISDQHQAASPVSQQCSTGAITDEQSAAIVRMTWEDEPMVEQADIVEFLNKRYAEEEEAARIAGEAVGYTWISDGDLVVLADRPGAPKIADNVFLDHGVEAAHIALHDPSGALHKVQSNRQMLKIINDAEHEDADGNGRYLDMLKILASAYDGHSDYDEAWAVS